MPAKPYAVVLRGTSSGYRYEYVIKRFATSKAAQRFADRKNRTTREGMYYVEQQNPAVKGRKVKGGRAISLKDFTGTVTRYKNGTVSIKGVRRRG